jgi:hypothetical protein
MSDSTVLSQQGLRTKKEQRKEKLKLKKKLPSTTVKSLKLTKRDYSQRKRNLLFKKRLEAKTNAEAAVSSAYEVYKYVGDLKQVPLRCVDSADLEDPNKYELNVIID